jgi:hypothetical protein
VRVVLALTVARAWRRTLALALALMVFELLVGLSYASVDQNQIRQVVESLPPALRALASGADVASPSGYLGTGFAHPVALTLAAALAVSVAAIPARDVEHGVAEVLLARPLAPVRWMGAQALAMAILLAAVVAGGLAGGLVAVWTVDDLASVSPGGLVLVALTAWLVALTIGATTLAGAAVSRTGGRAIGIGAGFAVVAYALNYLAQVWTVMDPLGRISVYRYFRPAEVLREAALPWGDTLVLGAVAVALTAAALALTARRELAP